MGVQELYSTCSAQRRKEIKTADADGAQALLYIARLS